MTISDADMLARIDIYDHEADWNKAVETYVGACMLRVDLSRHDVLLLQQRQQQNVIIIITVGIYQHGLLHALHVRGQSHLLDYYLRVYISELIFFLTVLGGVCFQVSATCTSYAELQYAEKQLDGSQYLALKEVKAIGGFYDSLYFALRYAQLC